MIVKISDTNSYSLSAIKAVRSYNSKAYIIITTPRENLSESLSMSPSVARDALAYCQGLEKLDETMTAILTNSAKPRPVARILDLSGDSPCIIELNPDSNDPTKIVKSQQQLSFDEDPAPPKRPAATPEPTGSPSGHLF